MHTELQCSHKERLDEEHLNEGGRKRFLGAWGGGWGIKGAISAGFGALLLGRRDLPGRAGGEGDCLGRLLAYSPQNFFPLPLPSRCLSRGGLQGLSLTSILLSSLIYAAEWNDLP